MNYWLQYVLIAMILISYLSSLNAFRLDMAKPYKQFSYYLLFVSLGELFAFAWQEWLYRLTPFPKYTQWFYNGFHYISYLFIMYFFYQVLRSAGVRNVLKVMGILYAAFALINMLFIQGLIWLNSYSELLASVILIFSSVAYFYQLLFAKKVETIKNNPLFWISSGVLLSHLGSVLALYLINNMTTISLPRAYFFLSLIRLAGIFTYLIFLIAFLCQKKK
jgi:hypothetical protein